MSYDMFETRQERRERKLKKRRERMLQHGKGLAKIYQDAVTKRLKQGKTVDQKP